MHEVLAPPPDSPKDHHIVRIAAKRLDIRVYPLQGGSNVKDALIAGGGILFAREIRQEEISQKSQAVIACHHHNVVFSGEVAAVLVPAASGPYDEATAVVVEHDRTPTMIHSRASRYSGQGNLQRGWLVDPRGSAEMKAGQE